MPKYQPGNSKYKVEMVIQELGDGCDLQRVMDRLELSPVQVMNMMQSSRGKELIKARRRLAKIHRELLASRFSAFAVQRMCGVLQQEGKPELWLKAAAEILEAVKGERRDGRKGERKEEEEEMLFTPEEAKRLTRAVCVVLAAEEKGEVGR